MNNQTFSIRDFEIVAFSSSSINHQLIFFVFSLIYLVGLLGNLTLITCVVFDTRLHSPMYIFLSNLSSGDIMFTSSTLPKLMDILVSGNNTLSFTQCFAQMFFYLFASGTDDILLSCMAYDRFVAVCKPLHYNLIMSKANYIILLVITWSLAFVNSLFFTLSIHQIDVCYSNKIQHFFCDVKAFDRIACSHNRYRTILYFEIALLGLFPFILSLASYVKIIQVICRIKSTDGRMKAFSTCTSHLTILMTFYGAGICMYIVPSSGHFEIRDLIFSALYTAVSPMLNPLIYSLRNTEVKEAIKKLMMKLKSLSC